MSHHTFRAILAKQGDPGLDVQLVELSTADLPAGDVLVRVTHSSLNYKDALAVTGQGKIFRRLPMVPGVDLAGVVEESAVPEFEAGDLVVVTGTGIGEVQWGGFSQYARLDSGKLLKIPEGWGGFEAMSVGTAGITAMLCIMALEEHGILPGDGPVLVTGAGGGVGGMAVALLHGLGFDVAAATGRESIHSYLETLGARTFVARSELQRECKPLEKEKWSGVVDAVGGHTLATAIRQTRAYGTITACGLAGGGALPTSVYPFILRNVTLCGIDSVTCPRDRRVRAWMRVRELLSRDVLADIAAQTISLADVVDTSEALLSGHVRGRIVVDLARP